MYFITSVEELQELNPFIIIGCGGGGEKFSNFEGVKAVGFIDDDTRKQGKEFCNLTVSGNLSEVIQKTDAKSVAIMLPIGAEGTALKYAVEAIDNGKNVVASFRSLPISQNESLIKFAESKGVALKEISPRLDVIKKIFGVAPPKCTETLPKITYKHKAPVVFVGGTSQECGKRTTTRMLGKAAEEMGLNAVVISTDEMGLEKPADVNFRAGSLSVMDVASAVMGTIKYMEENKDPDIIFVEGQSSLTERGNPHPKGLSAAILFGAMPDATIVCHRPNHPYREPTGIEYEVKAIEAVEPTKVVGISLNLRNVEEPCDLSEYEKEYGLPAVDIANGLNGGASRLLKVIIDHIGEFKK
ncbi:DUF1611 domain-containing protein [Methanobacterium aggregans]|uniref:DUF1611 domain-containing protein n=1 Tax=Methanobacterium aggregans TaxID=1615586 RepID=UPI001AE5795D|nr:DUF1611 domain-containing protein [Methanobacterium aggregans]MBP2046629.1 putative NAD-dependent epimerase/dehydratase family protein [Methanobacterium aggregans]